MSEFTEFDELTEFTDSDLRRLASASDPAEIDEMSELDFDAGRGPGEIDEASEPVPAPDSSGAGEVPGAADPGIPQPSFAAGPTEVDEMNVLREHFGDADPDEIFRGEQ